MSSASRRFKIRKRHAGETDDQGDPRKPTLGLRERITQKSRNAAVETTTNFSRRDQRREVREWIPAMSPATNAHGPMQTAAPKRRAIAALAS